MIACLTILLTGCNGNTAKETARNDTVKGFLLRLVIPKQKKQMIQQVLFRKQSNRYQVKQQQSRVSRKSRMFLLRQVVRRKLQKAMNPFRYRKSLTVLKSRSSHSSQNRKHRRLRKKWNPTKPKPTEEPKQSFDVNPYVSYARSYAQSIGLELDSTATDCWDNPITANAKRTGIKDDIQSRLNRYKNVEGFTAVWVWVEKVSDTEYEIYIGYC